MNKRVLTIMNAEKMLTTMIGVLEKVNKDFSHIRQEQEQAMQILRQELGNERLESFIDAVNRRCKADLLFCGSLGYQANLKNFRDPTAHTFMEEDFEEYLQMDTLQKLPKRQAAQAEIDAFYRSLNEIQKGVYDTVSSYLVCLELDLTKLAHYAGFLFANEVLEYTEPNYVPNLILTLRYQSFMKEWYGTNYNIDSIF